MMKRMLTICVLSGILAGCGATQYQIPNTQPTPKPPLSTNPFDSVSFPQDACGDKLPEDPQAYPVEFYPVYIDYSESNLQAVTSKFCRDALKKYRETKGKDYIQVASLVGKERANQFKDLMQQEFGSGEIGEPSVINASKNIAVSPSAIGNSAKLTDSELEQLISLDKTKISRDGNRKHTFRVVLPTYIPDGFKVDGFIVREDHKHGHSYEIRYRNQNNTCFGLKADNGQWGGPVAESETLEVLSQSLGLVILRHSSLDQISNSYLDFRKDLPSPQSSPKTAYSFWSITGSKYYTDNYKCKFSLSLQEGVHVIESLQYLTP